jgi:hypothetical protein
VTANTEWRFRGYIHARRGTKDRGEYRKAAGLTSQGHHSPMTEDDDLLEDPSWLKDHDWIEVNNLRRAYEDGGKDALVKAWAHLYRKDFDQFTRVACAVDPGHLRRIRDAVENAGYTFQDLIELAKKKQH